MRTPGPTEDVLVSADGVIVQGKCDIHSITLFSGTASPGKVIAYDGADTGGDKRFQGSALQNDSRQFIFKPPLRFHKGLYLDVTVTSGSVHVQYDSFRD